jgi:hypothetical protein
MEKKEFKISIDAPRDKVWDVLWNDETYPEWTSVFAEGSHAKTDWEEGSTVHFLDGKGSGMISKIKRKKPYEFMSFEHLGVIKDDIQDTESEEVKQWAGAHEDYTLHDRNGKTELVVEMDIVEDYADYFMKTFPKALQSVKQLSEA